MVLHETNAYRQDKNILLYLIAQPLDMIESSGILLCRNDEFGREHGSKRVVDELYVLFVKLMMVSEGKRREMRGQWREVV